MGIETFEGDLLLVDSPDFGEIVIEDGIVLGDKTFNTATYLSLFGGNKDDDGKIKTNKTWWGNTLPGVSKNEKMVSRFQAVIFGLPMTSKNILKAESAAQLDLEWMIEEGIADEVIASGRATGKNKFELKVEIKAHGETIYSNKYSMFWRSGTYGSAN